MKLDITEIRNEIESCLNFKDLVSLNNKYLSRENGIVSNAMKNLGKISSPEEKKKYGADLNIIKKMIIESISFREKELQDIETENKIKNEKIDVTAPANYIIHQSIGSLHPITKTINELKKILDTEGFAIFDGYDIETTYQNFSLLNTDKLHPARQTQDTIYVNKNTINKEIRDSDYFSAPEDDKDFLLRTHTSAQQIRIAKKIINTLKKENVSKDNYKFKYATLGSTYRNESDSTHSPMFHQVELVCVSPNLYLQDLINVLMVTLSKFFNLSIDELKIKLRSSYFPFTVPSFEIDVFLPSKNEYVEILGCGMVHPSIIEAMGLDSKIYRGYAAGAGIERLCMLRNDIKDLRKFFQPNIEWLQHL